MQAEKSSAGKLHTNNPRGKQINKPSKGRASEPEITARRTGCLGQRRGDVGEARLPCLRGEVVEIGPKWGVGRQTAVRGHCEIGVQARLGVQAW